MPTDPRYFENDAIVEATFEIRFDSDHDPSLMAGLIYSDPSIQKEFGVIEPTLPGSPALLGAGMPATGLHVATHKFKGPGGQALLVGARSITFSALRPYPRWPDFVHRIEWLIDILRSRSIYSRVGYAALRYVNIFSMAPPAGKQPLDFINLDIIAGGSRFVPRRDATQPDSESFFLRMDRQIDGCKTVIVCMSEMAIRMPSSGESIQGPMLDIGTLKVFADTSFDENTRNTLDKMHDATKRQFLQLLTKDALLQMKPVYD